MDARRPRFALPFTIVPAGNAVLLVAGEDFRYQLSDEGLDAWLPALLGRMDGRRTMEDLVADVDPARRDRARALLGRLLGERVLVTGEASEAHAPVAAAEVEGRCALAERLRAVVASAGDARRVAVLCQDRLDYEEALRFQRRRREQGVPVLWATSGPLTRAFVGPLFLPDAGPCLGCLLRHFERLSPTPDLYDALRAHVARGGAVAPSPFPAPGVDALFALVRWKLDLAAMTDASAALYRLHVLEAESLEVTSHRVFVDPECAVCGGER